MRQSDELLDFLHGEYRIARKPVLSNLSLQIFIQYNLLFSLMYAILIGYVAVNKVCYFLLLVFRSQQTDILQLLQVINYEYYSEIAVFIIWIIMEPIRIFYGRSGNLKESVRWCDIFGFVTNVGVRQVPLLSTFLLITVFPQLPLVTFLAYFQPSFYPADRIMGSLMFIFLVSSCLFLSCFTHDLIFRTYLYR